MQHPSRARRIASGSFKPFQILVALAVVAFWAPSHASAPWPEFTATRLTGEEVSSNVLVGQPTLLVVTPSRDAGGSTRAWIKALRGEFERDEVLICDILAIDLPFFISTETALEKAKEKVPSDYHEHTWLLQKSSLEQSLNIDPSSEEAFVFVLDAQANINARAGGDVTQEKVDEILAALSQLTD